MVKILLVKIINHKEKHYHHAKQKLFYQRKDFDNLQEKFLFLSNLKG
jgi:hypothetical protein